VFDAFLAVVLGLIALSVCWHQRIFWGNLCNVIELCSAEMIVSVALGVNSAAHLNQRSHLQPEGYFCFSLLENQSLVSRKGRADGLFIEPRVMVY